MAKQRTPAAKPATPLTAIASTLTTTAPAVATVPAVAVPVPATFAGVPWAQLAKHQQAVATAKAPQQVAPAIAAVQYKVGKAYRVHAPNNVAWYAQCMGAMQANSGKATAAAMAAACGYPGFVGYLVRKGWLVPA